MRFRHRGRSRSLSLSIALISLGLASLGPLATAGEEPLRPAGSPDVASRLANGLPVAAAGQPTAARRFEFSRHAQRDAPAAAERLEVPDRIPGRSSVAVEDAVLDAPASDAGSPPEAVTLGHRALLSVGDAFDATPQAPSGTNPPDPQVAKGRDVAGEGGYIVQAVNRGIQVFLPTGAGQGYVPFAGPGGLLTNRADALIFDPRLVYDEYENRFVLIALETVDDSACPTCGATCQPGFGLLHVAISASADPTGAWFVFPTLSLPGTHLDFPSLGLDRRGYHIAANLFTFASCPCLPCSTLPDGVFFRVIDKTSMLDPINPQITTFADYAEPYVGFGSMRAVHQHGLKANMESVPLFVGAYRGADRTALRLVKLRDAYSVATLAADGYDLKVPAYSEPTVDAPQGGCTATLDVAAAELLNAEWWGGDLVTGHGIDSQDGLAPRNVVRWYRLRTGDPETPVWFSTVAETGTIDPGPNRHAFLPALTLDRNGSVVAVFTVTSLAEPAQLYATGKARCEQQGAMGPLTLLRSSAGCMNQGSGNPRRWGDYFDFAVDPEDTSVVWATGEFVDAAGEWATVIAPLTADPDCFECYCGLEGGGPSGGVGPGVDPFSGSGGDFPRSLSNVREGGNDASRR